MAAVFRGVFGYCFLVFAVRIAGRRPGKQITPFEFVLIFFLGGITLTPMVSNDRSLINAFVIITTIATTHFLIARLKQWSPGFGRVVDGTPLVVLKHGEWIREVMKKARGR
jgi:uncharacterized membrane protein YcaP (DUF421 family)